MPSDESQVASPGALESLRAVPLFSRCSADELAGLASSAEVIRLKTGDVLFREGDAGDAMYVIEAGQLRVVSDVAAETVVFAHLAPGDFVGEMALITGEPRSAGVIATTDVRLLRLTKERFDTVAAANSTVSVEITRLLGERVRSSNFQRFRNEVVTHLDLTPERPEITIGRLPENDLVIDDPQVDAVHARIMRRDGRWIISDENSSAGTYVNRERIINRELQDGDEVLIGTNKVFLQGLAVRAFAGREGIRLDALNLTKALPDGRRIVDDVSLSIYPGELVAVVGGSGAGKTSLLHALNGFSPATHGVVRFNGLNLYDHLGLFRSRLGYVPQDDIVHRELTVERTLYYGARLRLPADTAPSEIERRVEEALGVVGLEGQRKTEVKRLSGGQRKRVSIALELLAKPKAIFLDEPTSGLDPALESRMTSLFRELAEQGATVVVSTHVTENLPLCDKVCWLASGGRLVFFGSPAEALRHFGVARYGQVYELLEESEGLARWAAAYIGSPAQNVNVQERLAAQPGEGAHSVPQAKEMARTTSPTPAASLRQLYWLTRRYVEVMSRDLAHLALMLFQAPVVGGLLLLLFSAGVFTKGDDSLIVAARDTLEAMFSLQVLTAFAIFLGATNAAREITKETPIYARERLVNLGVLPYVLSKVAVLSVISLIQSMFLVGVFAAGVDLSELGWDIYPKLLMAIFLTSLGGLCMGLLVSAAVGNSDRAMAIVPILVIPQLLLAGAIVPLERMLWPARALAQVMMSKWALELTGYMAGLEPRFAALAQAGLGQYRSAFDIVPWMHWGVLVGFVVVMLGATVLVQKRKDLL